VRWRAAPGARSEASSARRGEGSGKGTTAVGVGALVSNYWYYNTAIGYDALYYNTGGSRNTASGYQALYSNTTGFENTASGFFALYNSTTGSHNTASGVGALVSDTIGSANTANGSGALAANTTGYNNTAFGTNACLNLLTGSNVICIGVNAGPAGDIRGPPRTLRGSMARRLQAPAIVWFALTQQGCSEQLIAPPAARLRRSKR
jgi:hypothetical protein